MKALPTPRPALLFPALAAVLLSTAALPAAAQDEARPSGPPEFRIDESGWTGGAVARDGRFSHCAISRDVGDGRVVVFQVSPAFQLNVVVASEAWTLEPGQEFSARIAVDDRLSKQYPAVNAAENAVLVASGRDQELVESLMRGSTATVDIPDLDAFAIPLTGTFNAFQDLQSCIQKAREMIEEAQGQAGGQAGGQVGENGGPAGTGEARAPGGAPTVPSGRSPNAPPTGMDARALMSLLRDAGFEEIALADPASIPENELALSHVWQIDESLIGGLHQRPRDQDADMAGFVDAYTQVLADRCPGQAEVETGETQLVRDLYAFADATVDCTGESGGSAHVALFFALDDNHYSAFFHETTIGQAERADRRTALIADYIRALAEAIPPEAAAEDTPPAEDGSAGTGDGAGQEGATEDGAAPQMDSEETAPAPDDAGDAAAPEDTSPQ